MTEMKAKGYTIDDMPENIEALQRSILEDPNQQFSMADLNAEYRMPVEEYQRLCPYAEDLNENWGPPPGNLNTDGKDMLIFGKRFGNIFLGIQQALVWSATIFIMIDYLGQVEILKNNQLKVL